MDTSRSASRSAVSSIYSFLTSCQALCIIPIPIFRWSLVGLAAISSGYFLIANVNPILASSASDPKAARILIPALIGVLHLALALTLKVLFFSYYIVKEIGSDDPLGDGPVRP